VGEKKEGEEREVAKYVRVSNYRPGHKFL